MAKRRNEELPKTEGRKSVAIKNAPWHDDAESLPMEMEEQFWPFRNVECADFR